MPGRIKHISRSSGRSFSPGLPKSYPSQGNSVSSSVSQSRDRYVHKPSLETQHLFPNEDYNNVHWSPSERMSGPRRQSIMNDALHASDYSPQSAASYWDPLLSSSSAILGQPQAFDAYSISSSGSPLEPSAFDSHLHHLAPHFPGGLDDGAGLNQSFGLPNEGSRPSPFHSGSSSNYTPPHSPESDLSMPTGMMNEYGQIADFPALDLPQSQYSGSQQEPPSPPSSEGDYPFSAGSDPLSGYPLHSDMRNDASAYPLNYPSDFRAVAAGDMTYYPQIISQVSRPAHRTLKPAPQRPREQNLEAAQALAPGHGKSKNKPTAPPPRSHHLYKATPDEDGMYRCPYQKEHNCSHPPTKQKCGYDKYLDSHLRPYHCRQEGCENLKFSSNACLFRHEREAHGLHAYGKNPHLCHYEGCERATEGFPRRWNLNDHMRRVHKHDSSPQAMDLHDDIPDYDVPSKRKGSGVPISHQMKRTSSSQAKARAASGTYSRERFDHADMGLGFAQPTMQFDYSGAYFGDQFTAYKESVPRVAAGYSFP